LETIIAFVAAAGRESLTVLLESAPYALAGFFAAGLFRAFVPESLLSRHLGGGGFWPVLKASLIGIPMPLCSCGVVPAAVGLRRSGASPGAATAFLVSTPETGADSIAVNYALLDPVMTVVRPLAAIVTAVATGLAINRFGGVKEADADPGNRDKGLAADCGGGCCAAQAVPVAAGEDSLGGRRAAPVAKPGVRERLRSGMAYAFGEILSDVGGWLLLGVVIAGVIGAALPADGLTRHLGSGLAPMAAMLVLSAPLYVCATASTPIVAALALKGLSPGAALVFLLAGPATNIAGMTVFARLFGPRAAVVYYASIAACSLAFGLAVDALYGALGIGVTNWLAQSAPDEPGVVSYACAVVLAGLVVRAKLAERAQASRPG
jgi:uncharacterized protein